MKEQLARWLDEIKFDYISAAHSEICGSYFEFDSQGLAIAIIKWLTEHHELSREEQAK